MVHSTGFVSPFLVIASAMLMHSWMDQGVVLSFQPAIIASLDTFWKTHPYAAAAFTCGVKASAADFVAQKRQYKLRTQEKEETSTDLAEVTAKPRMDYRRNIAFLLYGAVYQGMAQEFMYNHVYPAMFGRGTSFKVVFSTALYESFIQNTLVTFPIAYLTKALIFRYSFREAIRRYVDDVKNHGLLTKSFCLWGPVNCLTFSIVPEHLRVTFIACVSFFWLIILSTIASRRLPPVAEEECSLVDGQTCNIDG